MDWINNLLIYNIQKFEKPKYNHFFQNNLVGDSFDSLKELKN